MYLREMGSVELLSREGEIAIAKRIEAGREMMIGGICESPMTIRAMIDWHDALIEGKMLLRDIIDLDATYGSDQAPTCPRQNCGPVGPDGDGGRRGADRPPPPSGGEGEDAEDADSEEPHDGDERRGRRRGQRDFAGGDGSGADADRAADFRRRSPRPTQAAQGAGAAPGRPAEGRAAAPRRPRSKYDKLKGETGRADGGRASQQCPDRAAGRTYVRAQPPADGLEGKLLRLAEASKVKRAGLPRQLFRP